MLTELDVEMWERSDIATKTITNTNRGRDILYSIEKKDCTTTYVTMWIHTETRRKGEETNVGQIQCDC